MVGDREAKREIEIQHLRHLYGLEYEMIRAIAAFEHAALRPLFLLSGGALVVYMGVFGALRRIGEQGGGLDWTIGRYAVMSWAFGLFFATIATIGGAYSQFYFRGLRGDQVALEEIKLGLGESHDPATEVAGRIEKNKDRGNWGRKIALVSGIASLALFAAGLALGYSSILG